MLNTQQQDELETFLNTSTWGVIEGDIQKQFSSEFGMCQDHNMAGLKLARDAGAIQCLLYIKSLAKKKDQQAPPKRKQITR